MPDTGLTCILYPTSSQLVKVKSFPFLAQVMKEQLSEELMFKLADELAVKLGDELKERVAKRHGL